MATRVRRSGSGTTKRRSRRWLPGMVLVLGIVAYVIVALVVTSGSDSGRKWFRLRGGPYSGLPLIDNDPTKYDFVTDDGGKTKQIYLLSVGFDPYPALQWERYVLNIDYGIAEYDCYTRF